ncbi:MAG: hypothetical protein WC645_08785, partial [Candidatus Margulisiibacteriota bacterium]
MPRYVLFGLICFLFFNASGLVAQELATVEGTGEFLYDDPSQMAETSGEATVAYDDIRITSTHMRYDRARNIVAADEPFTLDQSGRRLTGTSLDYDLTRREGTAQQVKLDAEG